MTWPTSITFKVVLYDVTSRLIVILPIHCFFLPLCFHTLFTPTNIHQHSAICETQVSITIAALSQGTNHTPSQLFQQWQSANREGNTSYSNEEEVKPQIHEQQSSTMEANRHGSGSGSETQHPPNDTSREMNLSQSEPSRPQDDQHNVHMSQTMNAQNTEKNPVNSQEPNIARNPENESQLQRMHRMGNQQQQQAMSATGQAANAMNRPSGKQVPFALLLPVIEPQLDKDRAMQLQGLYVRLRV